MNLVASVREKARGIGAGWNRFWFEPTDTTPLGLFRIAFGFVITLWTLSHLPDLFTFLGPNGVLPRPRPLESLQWGLLNITNSVLTLSIVWLATLVASIALMLGRRPRLAALIVFLGVLSIERRNAYILNNGDDLVRYLAFYLMLAPSGAALSLDRWRADRANFWTAEWRAPWAMRLLQIQLSLIYVSTVWAKLQGETWRNGTAVSFALRVRDIIRFPPPAGFLDSIVVSEWLTFGTLLLELSLGVLVWNRRARPYVLALGVLMHLLIGVGVIVGFFSLGMLCLYLVFLSPAAANRLVARSRALLARRQDTALLSDRDESGEDVARST